MYITELAGLADSLSWLDSLTCSFTLLPSLGTTMWVLPHSYQQGDTNTQVVQLSHLTQLLTTITSRRISRMTCGTTE